jgi:hypothetical protein
LGTSPPTLFPGFRRKRQGLKKSPALRYMEKINLTEHFFLEFQIEIPPNKGDNIP